MGTFWPDLRFGLRLAASRPLFTVVAVIALALGIGPNTAIFSIVNSLLLTPPPYDDPDTIVTASQKTTPAFDGPRLTLPSTDDFQDWRRETRNLQQIALYASDSLTLTGFDDPIRLSGARVSPAMFPLLSWTISPLGGEPSPPVETANLDPLSDPEEVICCMYSTAPEGSNSNIMIFPLDRVVRLRM